MEQSPYAAIIDKILVLVGFQEDRAVFTASVLSVCQRKTITALFLALPFGRRLAIGSRIALSPTFATLEQLVYQQYDQPAYQACFEEHLVALVSEYLEEVWPTLSTKHQQNVAAFLTNIQTELPKFTGAIGFVSE